MRKLFASPFWFWIVLAFLIRALSSWTHSTWNHPDEWYQTVEFANFISIGTMSYTQEVAYHMRNLSWPALLSFFISIAKTISPSWVGLRIFLIQFMTGVLDLIILWGYWVGLEKLGTKNRWIRFLVLGLFVAPWFSAWDSLRPSQEHIAAIALWLTLVLLWKDQNFLSGLFTVAIGAFKYPAGLMGAGIALAVHLRKFKSRDTRGLLVFWLGLVSGLFFFGLADWIFYGRPWESLWMYLQYNVFTGMSSKYFGSQGPLEFWNYFAGHWGGVLFPVGILLIPFFLIGLKQGLQKVEPWAFALVFYLAGHLLTPHKEARFMTPIEFLVVWCAVYGALNVRIEEIWQKKVPLKRVVIAVFGISFIFNSLFLLRNIWGDNWVSNETYFELNRHLQEVGNTCAIVTVRKPISVVLPWDRGTPIPSPALGYFPTERNRASFPQTRYRPLIWVEYAPNCTPDQNVLIHLHKPGYEWDTQGCNLLPSGILKLVPRRFWDHFIEKNWASGSWYRCPPTILKQFTTQQTKHILVKQMPHYEKLPPLGIDWQELSSFGGEAIQDQILDYGTFGEW